MPLLALKMLEVGGGTIKDAVISFFCKIWDKIHKKEKQPLTIYVEACNSIVFINIIRKD